MSSRFLKAISQKQYMEALEISKRFHNANERSSLAQLVQREWNADREERLGEFFDKGDYPNAYEDLLIIRNQSLKDHTNNLLLLKPLDLSRYLLHAIHADHEKYAIQTMTQLQPYKKFSFQTLKSAAYAHWSLRTFHRGLYHDSLLMAGQSLAANSQNRLAQSVVSRISAIKDRLVSKGLVAYRHQKIHQAIAYWTKALKIDPSNEKVKQYILEAQGILNKIRTLKDQDVSHNPPT